MLQERHADPPDGAAQVLALGGLLVENATAGEGVDEAHHAHRPEIGVDANLDELRSERVLRERLLLLARLRVARPLNGGDARAPYERGDRLGTAAQRRCVAAGEREQ